MPGSGRPFRVGVGPAAEQHIAAVAAVQRLRHALPSPAGLIQNPEAATRAFRVTTIGDIRVDVRGYLGTRFQDVVRDHQEDGVVSSELGGTAIGFARAAAAHFADVHVVGAMGHDAWTGFIRAWCDEVGVEATLAELPQPNSVVVVLRDRETAGNPDGVRLLLAGADSPYRSLDAASVLDCRGAVEDADALVVDGYALLADPSAEAIDTAVELAVRAGVPVCFDVVPHQIDTRLELSDLRPFFHRASLVTIEVATMLRLLGESVPDRITLADVLDLSNRWPADLSSWQRTWFLRFGHGAMEEVLAVSAGHHRVHYRTGYAQAATPAGYGYLVAAAELKWWLMNHRRATAMYPALAGRARVVSARAHRSRPADPPD